MWVLDIIGLVVSLAVILLCCELFTNGIEWLGKRLKLGDGVVGSIFSAVGTCLPETAIPVIAILFSNRSSASVDIGIGAIAGAPFMLGTLAFFVTGISVVIFRRRRKTGLSLNINARILSRDIGFFIIVYTVGISTGIATSFYDIGFIRYVAAIFLIGYYVYYITLTVKNDSANHVELETLHIVRFINTKPGLPAILFQIILALTGIVLGAELFVKNLEAVSELLGISTLVLSLILTPVATELPEKFNSVIWIRKNKDTLALGNITGAMVFQSCIPVAIGILATSWKLDLRIVVSALIAISSAAFSYFRIKFTKRLDTLPLITGGLFYILFILFIFTYQPK